LGETPTSSRSGKGGKQRRCNFDQVNNKGLAVAEEGEGGRPEERGGKGGPGGSHFIIVKKKRKAKGQRCKGKKILSKQWCLLGNLRRNRGGEKDWKGEEKPGRDSFMGLPGDVGRKGHRGFVLHRTRGEAIEVALEQEPGGGFGMKGGKGGRILSSSLRSRKCR